jgi:hypothetical protein
MHPPRWRYATEALATVARHLLAKRERRYPALIEARKIEAAVAETNLRIARAIAADWDRAWSREKATITAADATQPERINTLIEAAQRSRARISAARNPEEAADLEVYAEMVETLLWWEHHPLGIAFLNRTTDQLRADARSRRAPEARAA